MLRTKKYSNQEQKNGGKSNLKGKSNLEVFIVEKENEAYLMK